MPANTTNASGSRGGRSRPIQAAKTEYADLPVCIYRRLREGPAFRQRAGSRGSAQRVQRRLDRAIRRKLPIPARGARCARRCAQHISQHRPGAVDHHGGPVARLPGVCLLGVRGQLVSRPHGGDHTRLRTSRRFPAPPAPVDGDRPQEAVSHRCLAAYSGRAPRRIVLFKIFELILEYGLTYAKPVVDWDLRMGAAFARPLLLPCRRACGTTPIQPTGEVRPASASRARNQVREPRRRRHAPAQAQARAGYARIRVPLLGQAGRREERNRLGRNRMEERHAGC